MTIFQIKYIHEIAFIIIMQIQLAHKLFMSFLCKQLRSPSIIVNSRQLRQEILIEFSP